MESIKVKMPTTLQKLTIPSSVTGLSQKALCGLTY
jgi:hypothetical protein